MPSSLLFDTSKERVSGHSHKVDMIHAFQRNWEALFINEDVEATDKNPMGLDANSQSYHIAENEGYSLLSKCL